MQRARAEPSADIPAPRPAAPVAGPRLNILRHLPYFIVAAELEHFNRAARRLNMTQPALSRRIRDMELELGVDLFTRDRRGVTLTEAGRMLRDDAGRIVRSLEKSFQRIKGLDGPETVDFRLAMNEAALRNAGIGRAVNDFRKACPAVRIEFLPMFTEAQHKALLAGEIDACLLYDFGLRDQGLGVFTIAAEDMVLAVSADHPLARRPSIRLQDLAGEPLSLPDRKAGPRLRARMLAAWTAAGLSPPCAVLETHSGEAVLGAAGTGLAMGFVTEATPAPANVVLRRVSDFNVRLELSLAWRPDNESPALAAFVEAMERRLKRSSLKG